MSNDAIEMDLGMLYDYETGSSYAIKKKKEAV